MSRKIIIGLISPTDILDRKASSGTIYKIADSLKNIGYEVKWIKVRYDFLSDKVRRKINNLVKIIPVLNFADRNRLKYAEHASSSIDITEFDNCDILFFPFQSYAFWGLRFDKPVIYLSDATFELMVDYYFKGLTEEEINIGNKIESYAMNHSDAIILSSNWAANSAVNFYKQQPFKVNVIEFGANIDDCDIINKEFRFDGQLNLLFLGVDWNRKGGAIAVDTCRYLNEIGCNAMLHIIGIKELDNDIKNLSFINYIGFLNKNDKEQYKQLVSIIQKCHCLLLPTLAECSAIAFAESSAYGLPIFSHKTGGVSNYVYNGKNGYLLPIGSTGKDFGNKIKECLNNGELQGMSRTAIEVYRSRLNWHTWSIKVKYIIDNLLQNTII